MSGSGASRVVLAITFTGSHYYAERFMSLIIAAFMLLVHGADVTAIVHCEPPAAVAAEATVHALEDRYSDAARTHGAAWFDEHMTAGTIIVLEIRSFNLKPGARAEFHQLVVDEAAPMHARRNVDLVDYGPSAHDDDSYFVLRAYPSIEERLRSQEDFYGSREWIDGPRSRIIALIESSATIVVPLPSAVIDGMRRTPVR